MMKKVLSLVLVLTLVLALAVPAFAIEQGSDAEHLGILSINLTNAKPNTTYTVYRVFDLVTYDKALNAYRYDLAKNEDGSYKLDWATFSKLGATVDGETMTAGSFLTYKESTDGKNYIQWKDPSNNAEEDAGAQQLAQILRANKAQLIKAAEYTTTTETTHTFTGLKAGYYLVDSTAGVLCGMDTAQTDAAGNYVVTIKEKNVLPTTEKEVEEDSTGAWGTKNTADVGQTVNFRVIISAQPGAENYVLHDSMSKGLKWNEGSVEVYEFAAKAGKNDKANGTKLTLDTDYTVKKNADCTYNGDCDFEVAFTEEYLDKTFGQTNAAAKDIVVYYSAEVTEDAVINGENTNDSRLDYGEDNKVDSNQTKTYTFDFNIEKYGTTSQDNNVVQTKLADAHFTLYSDVECTKPIYFDKITLGEGENAKQEYRMNYDETNADSHDNASATTDLVTPKSGDIRLYGLDAATYYLKETQAPAGYNLDKNVVTVVIDEDGKVRFNDEDASAAEVSKLVRIENRAGAELPSTGGIGTTIFYVIGGLLVCAAVILLVTKKKVNN